MDQREIAKKIVGAIVQYGTGIIFYDLVQKNVETDRADKKVAVYVAGVALGGVVKDAASKHSDQMIDKIFDNVAEIRKRFQ